MKIKSAMAMDEVPMPMAFDKSVREYDGDGRLHVKVAHISKANVCPYKGSEIPDSEKLGLDPNKIYMLLRDPQELEKAASTSNNIQLLFKHTPVNATQPQKELTVGSTGTDAEWNSPYLDNSLVVWDKEAIDKIESNEQKELSAGYYYTADMTPGTYEGVAYDGVMRNIRFNHVALVVEGRAGSDVVVGDSMESLTMKRNTQMSRKAAMAKGAIVACLQPRLAQDAKLDVVPLLAGVTHANWGPSKSKIVAGLKGLDIKLFKDKPAMDAAVGDVVKLLDSLDGENPDKLEEGEKAEPHQPTGTEPVGGPAKDSPKDAILAMLKGKISDEDYAKVEELLSGAAGDDADGDNDIEEFVAKLMKAMGKGEATDEDVDGADAELSAGKGSTEGAGKEKVDGVGKAAMDAALKRNKGEAVEAAVAVTIKRMNALHDAERIVKPLVGEVLGMDSAEAVYRLALDQKGIDVTGVHPSAYKSMVQMLIKGQGSEGKGEKPNKGMAHDAAAISRFKEMFPDAGTVKQLG